VLYPAEAHDRLTDSPWSEARVREAIRAIVADACATYRPEVFWPAHEWDGFQATLPMKNVYCGAAGVAWALDALRSRGHAEPALEPADVARGALELFRREPDFMTEEAKLPQRHSALLVGEAGIVFTLWRLAPSDGLEDDLHALVRANAGNVSNELMWGVPGTLLAARALLAATGEDRWHDAVLESEAALRAGRDDEGLWTQQLYGHRSRMIGPVHGLIGNVLALEEVGNIADVLARTAVVEGEHANWPPSVDGSDSLRLQWCHGAPGVLIHAADHLDDDLLLAGAQLVWDAGPLGDEKGFGICHGTAGNGYALLRTFERTGDERWLERARAFAVHALEQVERMPGRYTLFTGGVGAALFAADCLDAHAVYPVLEDAV
jgi:Lanthionine synthetase C-like protein